MESVVEKFVDKLDKTIGATLLKVCLVGDSSVGKSSILGRFVSDTFSGDLKPTIGMDFLVKFAILKDGTQVKIQFWDTAGQERFRAVSTSYYKSADAVVIVYDVGSYDSFKSVTSTWLKELERNAPDIEKISVVVCGNKADLRNVGETDEMNFVGTEDVENLKKKLPLEVIECSAKTGQNVKKIFETVVTAVMAKRNEKSPMKSPTNSSQSMLGSAPVSQSADDNDSDDSTSVHPPETKYPNPNNKGCQSGLKSGSNETEI